MKASSLLPSSPRVFCLFCPLLSCSLSSVSLRAFFGEAHLITIAGQATSSYRNVLLLFFLVMAKLERAQFYAWLIESVVIRCTCCFSCFPSSSGSIETTQTTLSLHFPDEPKKMLMVLFLAFFSYICTSLFLRAFYNRPRRILLCHGWRT